ncbi:Protein F32B5.7 [Aphelenchoides avenae]|nr:Protein F32B5.7 [Aphelenchus avenae]
MAVMAGYAASEVSKCSSCANPKSSAEDHPTGEGASIREKRQYNNGYYGSYSNSYSYPQQYSYGTQQRSSCLMQSLLNHKIFCARKKRDVGSEPVEKVDRQAEVEKALDKARRLVSIDLAAAAEAELRQLELFQKHPELLNEQVVGNAIRRYETCWLPMKPDVNMTAPLDVMLVWHAHMLRPSAYSEDSSRLAGAVVDHAHATKNVSNLEQTILRWQSVCAGEPFESLNVGPVPDYKSQSSYDIAAAVKRQHKFAKKIFALNMTCEDIQRAVEEYMKFLAIAAAYPDLAIAPTLEMDLAWHAHQVHPLAYARDTEAISGDLVDHVDEIDEDEPVELPTDLFAKHVGGAL